MEVLEALPVSTWGGDLPDDQRDRAITALETGKVLALPHLSFAMLDQERHFVRAEILDGSRKNVSFDPASGRLGGTALTGADAASLAAMMRRFSDSADLLVRALAPRYAAFLKRGRTSFRPVEVEARPQSPRHDDRRLHVDAFPARPLRGQRILRVFANVATDGAPRCWEVGEPFADFARAFLPRVRGFIPGSTTVMAALGITKGRRSRHDHVMLQLHDLAKRDAAYQNSGRRTPVAFAAGTSWIVFTDAVLHAALSGHGALEQTFYLPVEAMRWPDNTPLRILEKMSGRALV